MYATGMAFYPHRNTGGSTFNSIMTKIGVFLFNPIVLLVFIAIIIVFSL